MGVLRGCIKRASRGYIRGAHEGGVLRGGVAEVTLKLTQREAIPARSIITTRCSPIGWGGSAAISAFPSLKPA